MSIAKGGAVVLGACLLFGASVARSPSESSTEAKHELRNAITRTLDASALRSERSAARGEAVVEEFIAPDRYRVELPPTDLLPGPPTPRTTFIQIGRHAYLQDAYAPPPADQLFVACRTSRTAGLEVLAFLQIARRATDVHEASTGGTRTLRFRFPHDLKVKPKSGFPGLRDAPGSVVVREGLIQELRIRLANKSGSKHADVRWSLTYEDVAPIDAPSAEQIAGSRTNCTSASEAAS